jgi:quercetin dioxygenase-like cupin family protein
MEFIRADTVTRLFNPGAISSQLLCPENSRSERITITRVTIEPGARNQPHRHAASEQIWVALRGSGHLLLEGGQTMPFAAGDVARFEDNELHGFENTGTEVFEYLSVTSPPVNFRRAYRSASAAPRKP